MKALKEIIKPYKERLKNANYSSLGSADSFLINKWRNRIAKGYYGFDGINSLWAEIIDDFLTELEKDFPNFEIHQIKLKFGGLRFYVDLMDSNSRKCTAAEKEMAKLEKLLFSEDLIY